MHLIGKNKVKENNEYMEIHCETWRMQKFIHTYTHIYKQNKIKQKKKKRKLINELQQQRCKESEKNEMNICCKWKQKKKKDSK